MSTAGRKKLDEAKKVIKDYGKLLKKKDFSARGRPPWAVIHVNIHQRGDLLWH